MGWKNPFQFIPQFQIRFLASEASGRQAYLLPLINSRLKPDTALGFNPLITIVPGLKPTEEEALPHIFNRQLKLTAKDRPDGHSLRSLKTFNSFFN